VKVLDAGCGRCLQAVDLPDDAYLVGIDLSPVALAENPSLDQRIVGDIQIYPLPRETFDLAVCWDVLEHVRDPRAALDNITAALRPGGRLIVGIPNVLSPKGLVTKFTPYRFHVFVYRRLFRFPSAGLPGHGPFRTYLRWALRPSAVAAYAARRGLVVEEMDRSPSPSMAAVFARFPTTTSLFVRIWSRLFGGADPRDSELRIVLRKVR
jgi:SAM-dependent methyltransferase